MIIEADTIRCAAERGRLADVVQECSPGKRRRARVGQFLEQKQRVHEDVALRMKFRWLLHAFHSFNFWQNFMQQSALIEELECALGMAFGKHAREFVAKTLSGDLVNLRREFLNCGEGCGINSVLKSRRKTNSTQHTQLILTKPAFRIADRTDDPRAQVLLTTNEIEYFVLFRIEQKAINGEIAALYVFPWIAAKPDLIGMTTVGIADIGAKGCDFHTGFMGMANRSACREPFDGSF